MIFDIVIIVLIALSAYLGYKKGFVKTISKFLSLVVSIVLAKLLHPVISGVIRKSFIGDFIHDKFAAKSDSLLSKDIPSFVEKTSDGVVNALTDAVIVIITVIIIMIVVFIAANAVINALNLITKLPFISSVNRTFGIFAGLIMGVFLVYLIMAVVLVVNAEATWLEGSFVASFMFKHNLLMNLIF